MADFFLENGFVIAFQDAYFCRLGSLTIFILLFSVGVVTANKNAQKNTLLAVEGMYFRKRKDTYREYSDHPSEQFCPITNTTI